MVNIKIKDIESMNDEELGNKLVELRKEMMKDNTQITTGTVPKSPGQVRMNKRIIARILTILNKRKKGTAKKEVKKEVKEEKKVAEESQKSKISGKLETSSKSQTSDKK